MKPLSFADLLAAVSGDIVAFRTINRLLPAGGPGDKLFPPTYAVSDRAPTRYALETRRVDGEDVPTVLLDSVASQANRMELALLEAWRRNDIEFPMLMVDFREHESTRDLGELTVLEAPHRIADALFRDSELDGTPFRFSEVGRAFTEATSRAATAVYRYCPTGLVFGVWDSTGPKGGLGAKYQRCLVSEIVGYNAVCGVKTASRLDPAGIQKGVAVYQHADADEAWAVDETDAAKDPKKKTPLPYGGGGDKGKPSSINHGNVAPSIDQRAGGVTIDYATQTTVLSVPALRRLRFQTDVAGNPLDDTRRRDAETAAHATLAALGLAAMAYHRADGFDLRSRCLLVPDGPLELEAVGRDGGEPTRYSLSPETAAELLRASQAHAAEHGFGWTERKIVLQPAAKLVGLIHKSHQLSRTDAVEEA